MKKSLKITLISAGAVILIAAGSITAVSVHKSSPEYALELAERYLNELNYEQAIIEFEKYLEIEPMDADAWLSLADTYIESGYINKAIETLEHGLDLTDDERIREKLGALKNPDIPAAVIIDSDLTNPRVIAEMLVNHIRNGTTIDSEVSDIVTGIRISGEDFLSVECEGEEGGAEADFGELSSIDFLEQFPNIRSVEIKYTKINDISALEKLPNLTHLTLYFDEISDLSALKNLKSLTSLTLSCNKISDISPLSELTNLTELDLWNNDISDISALKNLTNLTMLNLSDNKISDISNLKNLIELRELNLWSNEIEDISALKSMDKLVSLHLSFNKISNISSLRGLNKLTELNLRGNIVEDITPLIGMYNLSMLDLRQNSISYYDGINDIEGEIPDCRIIY